MEKKSLIIWCYLINVIRLESKGGIMKEYLVTTDYGQWNNIWIVLASDSKDAINQVWEFYYKFMNKEIDVDNKEVGYNMYKPIAKSDIKARSLGSLHTEYGKIINVN